MEVGARTKMAHSAIKGHLEYAYPHGDGLLILGWCSELADSSQVNIILGVAEREEKVPLSSCVRYWRPDVAISLNADKDEHKALYGFVATFPLPEIEDEIELVGVSLVANNSDEDIVALLVPERLAVEETMRINWSIWYRVMKHASQTLKMHQAFENLVTRFGKIDQSETLSSAHSSHTTTALSNESEGENLNPLRLGFDLCARISEKALLVIGWVVSVDNNVVVSDLVLTNKTNVHISEDSSEELSFLEDVTWIPRTDVIQPLKLKFLNNKVGFVCFIGNCSLDGEELSLIAHSETGDSLSTKLPLKDYSANPFALSEHLFTLFAPSSDYMREVLTRHIGPAMKQVWATYRKQGFLTTSSRQVIQYGTEPSNPKVSIIVPLYKRFDFVEYQLSQFALDPYMKDVEIIYVNDDPESQAGLINFCHANYPVFEIPFKLLHGGKNLGYAGANNLGASIAKADTLLLLNSDVMPREPGWLAKMLEHYKTTPNIGALGARLLYEDGSIQHDGMTYVKFPFFQDMWICEHPYKGLSEKVTPVKPGLREVEAVTGACLMIDKERFKQVGGLDKNYILGDFEDSDLCLKLRVKGYKSYMLSEVSLYHLERQSQNLFANNDWKTKLTIYNCWQHTERWDVLISQLKEARLNELN